MFACTFNKLKHSLPMLLNVRNPCTKASVQDGYIGNIVMSDEGGRNVLSVQMMEQLISKIRMFGSAPNIRVIVLVSQSDEFFASNYNFRELTARRGRQQQEQVFELATQLMYEIMDCPVPVIAKVDGRADFAGCQLVAQCDLAVCSEKSTFSTPGGNYGLFCSTSGVALARNMPKKFAMEMLLTGWSITAYEAEDRGLVNKATAYLNEDIINLCREIRKSSRSVIELGKKFYNKQVEVDLKEAYKMGAQIMVDNLQMRDAQVGIRKFINNTWIFRF